MTKYGFNFQWMYWTSPEKPVAPKEPDLRALDFMADHGFNFVRIPTSYWFWTRDFDYFNPDEKVFEILDRYLAACSERNLHMSLNIHRGPGYCINGNNLERHNLWTDQIAQDGFIFNWETFAKRYQGISSDKISFDLLNEPPNPGQYGLTRENHAALMRKTFAAIRAIDPNREIVINGLGGGHLAMPELADLGAIHSGRGYQPMSVSHHKAPWVQGYEEFPEPQYPGGEYDGKIWNLQTLREFYQPWRDVQAMGAKIHIGEFGCYKETPNEIALAWFKDLFSIYKEFGWGYGLWEFAGNFGIAGHGRPGTKYQEFHGYQIDRDLLDLMLESRDR